MAASSLDRTFLSPSSLQTSPMQQHSEIHRKTATRQPTTQNEHVQRISPESFIRFEDNMNALGKDLAKTQRNLLAFSMSSSVCTQLLNSGNNKHHNDYTTLAANHTHTKSLLPPTSSNHHHHSTSPQPTQPLHTSLPILPTQKTNQPPTSTLCTQEISSIGDAIDERLQRLKAKLQKLENQDNQDNQPKITPSHPNKAHTSPSLPTPITLSNPTKNNQTSSTYNATSFSHTHQQKYQDFHNKSCQKSSLTSSTRNAEQPSSSLLSRLMPEKSTYQDYQDAHHRKIKMQLDENLDNLDLRRRQQHLDSSCQAAIKKKEANHLDSSFQSKYQDYMRTYHGSSSSSNNLISPGYQAGSSLQHLDCASRRMVSGGGSRRRGSTGCAHAVVSKIQQRSRALFCSTPTHKKVAAEETGRQHPYIVDDQKKEKKNVDDNGSVVQFNAQLNATWNNTRLQLSKLQRMNEHFLSEGRDKAKNGMRVDASTATSHWTLHDQAESKSVENAEDVARCSPYQWKQQKKKKKTMHSVSLHGLQELDRAIQVEAPLICSSCRKHMNHDDAQKAEIDVKSSLSEKDRKQLILDLKSMDPSEVSAKERDTRNDHGLASTNNKVRVQEQTYEQEYAHEEQMIKNRQDAYANLEKKMRRYEEKLRNIDPRLLE